ncbi:MAG: TRAP transporter substrate-binding protein [Rhodobacteraceae bacterium]|nr:TRAP transporter substrate-binding protein [Paracoccaceae bacterium]
MLKNKLIRMTGALALLVSSSVTAMAADVTLTISSWAPPSQGMNAMMWPELIKQMEAATDGRVTGEIKYGLASPPAQYDLVLDGAADLTWIFHGYTPGRFVATKMIELPGYEGSAQQASVAYWRAHEKFFASLNEHKGVKLIGLMTHGVGVLHSNTKISSIGDISGMKLRLGGGVSGDVGAALGATGIRVPAPKVYETLASNAADGVMMPMEGKASFKLFEVAKHTYAVPGGFYRGSFAVIMNSDKFDSLSAADQAALSDVFGENLSGMAGGVWDAIDTIGSEKLAATTDNSYTEASAADAATWQDLSGAIITKVMGEVSDKGIDAEAARAFIAEQMSN